MDTLELLDKIREEVNGEPVTLRRALTLRGIPAGDWTSFELDANYSSVWVAVAGTLMPVFATDLEDRLARHRRDAETDEYMQKLVPWPYYVRRRDNPISFVATAIMSFDDNSRLPRIFQKFCKPSGSQKLVQKIHEMVSAACSATNTVDLADALGAKLVGQSGVVGCYISSTEMELSGIDSQIKFRLGLTTLD